jgi:hypothetical protein
VIALAFAFSLIAATAFAQREYPSPLVREEQTMIVDGKPETWRLVWSSVPKLDHPCGPKQAFVALTCPCMDFGYAESGDLSLVRIRDGNEVDRLSLSKVLDEPYGDSVHVAFVQRWRTPRRISICPISSRPMIS